MSDVEYLIKVIAYTVGGLALGFIIVREALRR